jgi:P27 family predicted phage terminase small subunit
MVPILHSVGCFTDSDWTVFAQFCGALDRYHAARVDMAANGIVMDTEKGRVMNPAVKVLQTATDQIVKIGNMFGMAPSSRVGLSGVPRDDARDDLERFKAEVG